MKTKWDLDVNVVSFVLSDHAVVRQIDHYPVIIDIDEDNIAVEIEVLLPASADLVEQALAGLDVDETLAILIHRTIVYGNARALMFGTPNMPEAPSSADPRETTLKEFQAV